jgi:hypothetical protein
MVADNGVVEGMKLFVRCFPWLLASLTILCWLSFTRAIGQRKVSIIGAIQLPA